MHRARADGYDLAAPVVVKRAFHGPDEIGHGQNVGLDAPLLNERVDDFPAVHRAPGGANHFNRRPKQRTVLKPRIRLAAVTNLGVGFQQSDDAFDVPDIDTYARALSVAEPS